MAQQRVEMYRNIHKAIRHIVYTIALALGSADFRDQKSRRESLEQLRGTITMLQEHEETFVHPPLGEPRAPHHQILRGKP
jgi:hypothetical protein